MSVATTIHASSHHRRQRNPNPFSQPLRYQTYQGRSSYTISDTREGAERLVARGLGRVRAEPRRNPVEERRSNSKGAMTSHASRRTYSTLKTDARETPVKEPRVLVREVRRRSDTEHRHHHRRSEKEDAKEDEKVFVYKVHKAREEEVDRSRPSTARRSTTNAGEVSRTRHEKQRTGDGELQRKHSERRTSHYQERVHAPLRRESRSIADHAPKSSRDRAPVTRSASVRETISTSFFGAPLKRSQSSARQARPLSFPQPTSPPVREKLERAPSTTRGTRPAARPSSIFGSIFGHSTPAKPAAPARPRKPERQVECITCLSDDVPISKSALLPCKHRMCNTCLRRIFTLSTTDPQHMPPTCCTKECINLKHVDKLFDISFKKKWNRKYHEYTTKNRIYCPARGCGSWIKPAHIRVDTSGGANGGRKFGKCQRCRMKVCCTCNNKWHSSRECPKDAATQEFIKVAKEEGWQRCFNCSATVELKEGCNHMTCRCRAEFCMICGLKWKTCDCPWFNYEAVEADRLAHMNVPQARRVPIANNNPNNPNPARGYQEELDRRREQELRDEALARRIQILGLDGEAEFIHLDNPAPNINPYHNNNRDWIRLAEALSGAYNPLFPQDALPQHNPPQPQPQPQHRQSPPPEPARPRLQQQQPLDPILRQNSTTSRRYVNNNSNNHNNTRRSNALAGGRVVPRRAGAGLENEAARQGSRGGGAAGEMSGAVRERPRTSGPVGERRQMRESLLAGIGEGMMGEARVAEWMRHVEPLV